MHKSKVSLKLHNGKIVKGQAKDLTTKNKAEFVHVQVAEHIKLERINLIDIHTLRVDGNDISIVVSAPHNNTKV